MRHSRGVADTLTAQTRLWPTAQVHDSQGKRGNTMDDHHHFPHDLHNAVEEHETWPTPTAIEGRRTAETQEARVQRNSHTGTTLTDATTDWPTPDASEGGAESTRRKKELGRERSGSGNLKSAVNAKLSPRWVEILMGVPIGWCLPSCTCPLTPVSTS